MLQFFRKGNSFIADKSSQVFLKIGIEIQCDPLSLQWILSAEVINTHQSIVDEVRSHLKCHDACTLTGDFLLLTKMLFYLIRQHDAIH